MDFKKNYYLNSLMSTTPDPNPSTVANMRTPAPLVAQFLEVFEQNCSGCSDYHIANFFRRLHQPLRHRIFDFDACLALIQSLITEGHCSPRIGIFGASDTTLLELVAEAIGQSGQPCEIEIIDRCLTPLLLCEQRAAELGLSASIVHGDLDTFSASSKFDIILMHGVLSLLPEPSRTLTTVRRALRPGGYIVISHGMGSVAPERVQQARVDQAQQNLQDAVRDLGLLDRVDLQALCARIDHGIQAGERRPNKITAEAQLMTHLKAAGLEIKSSRTLTKPAAAFTRRRGSRILISAQLAEDDPVPDDADHQRL